MANSIREVQAPTSSPFLESTEIPGEEPKESSVKTPGDEIEKAQSRSMSRSVDPNSLGAGIAPGQTPRSKTDPTVEKPVTRSEAKGVSPIGTPPIKSDPANTQKEIDSVQKVGKPSFWHKVAEVLELFFRALSPIFNLGMLLIRILRWAVHFAQKGINWIAKAVFNHKPIFHPAKMNWKAELVRAVGDIAGVVFPPAGAIAHFGLNYWFDRKHAEQWGGLNYVIGKNAKDYALGPEVDKLWNWTKGATSKAYDSVAGAVGGKKAEQLAPAWDA
jgi:hypothetical protein